MTTPRRSPLQAAHESLGAKFADFGGWQMPLDYTGHGVIKEHTAVRTAVGVFDVSHLGKAVVRGPGARAFVDSALTNDLSRIGPGQAQYTLCCDAETGGVVDDLVVYLHSDDELFLVPNAANTAEVVRRLTAAAPDGVEVEGRHEDYGVLAVQGPRSGDLLAAVGLPHEHEYMSFVEATWGGSPLTVCRTGYTGEHGYELVCAWDATVPLWDALLKAGEPLGVAPCGLAARDTLRTEMGYPLHGQDLSLEITPVQARAGWAVGWKKPEFWGRDALLREREEKPYRLLRGIKAIDRAIPRPHVQVLTADGTPVGEVTSGTFSPTLKCGIALALVSRSVAVGDTVLLDVRGRSAVAEVVNPPFVELHTRA